jgi:serine/threonine protein phosphatase PrpC
MRYENGHALRTGNRPDNQDRIGYVRDGSNLLMVLADGMGGHAGGDVAAEILVETACDHFREAVKPIIDPHDFIRDIIHEAHRTIVSADEDMPARSPCTTGVVCIVQGNTAWWGHVGDSRIYLLRDHAVAVKTRDHSYVEELVAKGRLKRSRQSRHPMRHYVTLCLGGRPEPPEVTLGGGNRLRDGDVVLLCSDGLWSAVDDAFIVECLQSRPIDEAVDELAYQAEHIAYPNSDNISVLAIRCHVENNAVKTTTAHTQGAKGRGRKLTAAIERLNEALTELSDEMKK